MSDSGKPDRYPVVNPAALLLAWHLASSATIVLALSRQVGSPSPAHAWAHAVRKWPCMWLRNGKFGASHPPLDAAPLVDNRWLARKTYMSRFTSTNRR